MHHHHHPRIGALQTIQTPSATHQNGPRTSAAAPAFYSPGCRATVRRRRFASDDDGLSDSTRCDQCEAVSEQGAWSRCELSDRLQARRLQAPDEDCRDDAGRIPGGRGLSCRCVGRCHGRTGSDRLVDWRFSAAAPDPGLVHSGQPGPRLPPTPTTSPPLQRWPPLARCRATRRRRSTRLRRRVVGLGLGMRVAFRFCSECTAK